VKTLAPQVKGAVRDAQGHPVAGAAVYFQSGPVSLPDIAALTGADGRFDLHAPVAGAYRMAARGPAGGVAERTVEVRDGAEMEFDLTFDGER